MLDTKIFDTQEVLTDHFESIEKSSSFIKSPSLLFLMSTTLTVVVCLQTMQLLQGSFPLFMLLSLSLIGLSYFYSLRVSVLGLVVACLGVAAYAALGTTNMLELTSVKQLFAHLSIGYFGTQLLITLASVCLAAYSRILKTNLKWQEQARYFAETHDELTLLLNKETFIEKLDGIIKNSNTSIDNSERFALILIDINALQGINKAHGYKAGNAALHTISDRLRQVAQHGDLIARIDDDCFALVVRDMAHNAQLSGYICRVNAMLNMPFDYAWTKISLDTKFSSSFYPIDGKTTQELIDLNIQKLDQN